MIWVLLALSANFLWAMSNVLDKILRTKFLKSSVALTAAFGIYGVVFDIGLFLFIGIPYLPTVNFFAALVSGILAVYCVIFYIKALSLEEASRVIPLWHMSPLFVLVFAAIFLGEILTSADYIAFTVILIGGILITTKRSGKVFRLSPALHLMLMSSLLAATSDVFLKFAHSVNALWQVIFVFHIGITLAALALFFKKTTRNYFWTAYKSHKKPFMILLLFSSLTGFIGNLAFNGALPTGPVTLISVFVGFQSLFVLVLATILSIKFPKFIKEEVDVRTFGIKLSAIVLMILGLYLLTV